MKKALLFIGCIYAIGVVSAGIKSVLVHLDRGWNSDTLVAYAISHGVTWPIDLVASVLNLKLY